jgi:hypothetical protein
LPSPYSSSYIDFYAPNLTTTTTVEVVFQIINNNVYINTLFGWYHYYVGLYTTNVMAFAIDTGGDVRNISTTFSSGQWYYMVFEMRSDVAMINNKMYLNGVQQTLQQFAPDYTPDRNFNGGNGRIASFGNMNQFYNYTGNYRYAMFRVYNRALTSDEITKNYKHLKPIYNLT